jgi:hypothetical protein
MGRAHNMAGALVTSRNLMRIEPAKATPCATCPWRRSNWGRDDTPHPEYNTAERRDAMWDEFAEREAGTGLRFGTTMWCHVGDGHDAKHECTGGVVLQQRECIRALRHGGASQLTYKGLLQVARSLCLRDEINLLGIPVMSLLAKNVEAVLRRVHPQIANPEIGHHALEPPQPGEFDRPAQSGDAKPAPAPH